MCHEYRADSRRVSPEIVFATRVGNAIRRRVASGSSMSGQPYLVRCGNSAPMQSGQWLRSELMDLRSVTRAKGTP